MCPWEDDAEVENWRSCENKTADGVTRGSAGFDECILHACNAIPRFIGILATADVEHRFTASTPVRRAPAKVEAALFRHCRSRDISQSQTNLS